jgi:hypothetical protein
MGKYPDFFANNPHISGSKKSKRGWEVGRFFSVIGKQ